MKEPIDYNVRAVERALQILNCFDNQSLALGVTEIARAVGLHKATAHRIVSTLVSFGYLERAADGQKYRLGLRLIDLGFLVVRRMDLRREALPYMNQLARRWGEACDLSVFNNDEVFYVEMIPSLHALTIAASVGRRLPFHATASGKLFLANLEPDHVDALLKKPLERHTANTITNVGELRTQLEIIRERGYAVDDEELENGIRSVAAPVRDHQGKMIAAISLPSPASRMTLERIPEIARDLIETTRTISRRMGWQPG